jgi:CHAD domain-containing protein
MSYQLSLSSAIPDAIRATAHDELAAAVHRLSPDSEGTQDPVSAVHGARKNLKKSRALLRLVRSELPKQAYRSENAALRDAGRSISAVRDADVMVASVDALGERYFGDFPASRLQRVRHTLADQASSTRTSLDAALLEDTLAQLRLATERARQWPVQEVDAATLRRGIATAYRRGRGAFARADAQPTTENLHDWRKRVKDLWYQHRLLAEAWPDVLSVHAQQAHHLSELLGDDHDLAVLAEHLADPQGRGPIADADVGPMLELIGRRRAELLAEARELAQRMYAEKPQAFAERMGRYLRLAGRAKLVTA